MAGEDKSNPGDITSSIDEGKQVERFDEKCIAELVHRELVKILLKDEVTEIKKDILNLRERMIAVEEETKKIKNLEKQAMNLENTIEGVEVRIKKIETSGGEITRKTNTTESKMAQVESLVGSMDQKLETAKSDIKNLEEITRNKNSLAEKHQTLLKELRKEKEDLHKEEKEQESTAGEALSELIQSVSFFLGFYSLFLQPHLSNKERWLVVLVILVVVGCLVTFVIKAATSLLQTSRNLSSLKTKMTNLTNQSRQIVDNIHQIASSSGISTPQQQEQQQAFIDAQNLSRSIISFKSFMEEGLEMKNGLGMSYWISLGFIVVFIVLCISFLVLILFHDQSLAATGDGVILPLMVRDGVM